MDDLPVGFRFYPTEEELVSFYLPNKLKGTKPDIDRVREELSLCRLYKRTKCLRSAYDRRPAPPAVPVVVAGDQAVAHHHEHQAATDQAITIISNNQQNSSSSPVQEINMIVNNSAAAVVVDGANSSSGDHTTNPSQSVESDQNNWEILATHDHNEPLWDWDDFNWFDV